MDSSAILQQYFGYPSFRPGQEEIVGHIRSGQDVLCVMPTGSGKSLCYQIPALLLPGITLVVSPLVSLMKDQVTTLIQSGVKAAYINSSLSPKQIQEVIRRAWDGQYKIIYVAPERLLTKGFLSFAAQAQISMVTVDEAHCVSQWGQDFRPSYLDISKFIHFLPQRPMVSAFTATATAAVRDDILLLLELRTPFVQISGFDRENLYFTVQRPKQKQQQLLSFLSNRASESGIIYCATRKTVEALCQGLEEAGHSATRYHAGLPAGERNRNQEDFVYDRKRIMVATNAFGMGIDKSNVRYVVHYNMPKNLESYYQEAGRAGRDGEGATCLLLYSPQDVRTNQFLITRGGAQEEPEEAQLRAALLQNELELLKRMTFYCTTRHCLRHYILHYFGDSSPLSCGHCGNCDTFFEERDITEEAQKILSCVIQLERQGRPFGRQMVANILSGSSNQRLLQFRLDALSTHGAMKGQSLSRILDYMDALMEYGYLQQSEGDYPVVRSTATSSAILNGMEPVLIQLPKEELPATPTPTGEHATDAALFEELRDLRGELAKAAGTPAYIVFSDSSLRDMCRKQPQTLVEFSTVSGVGKVKLERYGEAFLSIIRANKPARTEE